jgi:hypothetical protein
MESKTVEDKLLEYARIEHARKMQVLEEEHHLQMEILKIQSSTTPKTKDRATRNPLIPGMNSGAFTVAVVSRFHVCHIPPL